MNFSYNFSKESKPLLQNFLKIAAETKNNQFVDLDQYKKIINLFPTEASVDGIQQEIIEIIDSDNENESEMHKSLKELNSLHIDNSLNEDAEYYRATIKEFLESGETLPEYLFDNLQSSKVDLNELLVLLRNSELTAKETYLLGMSLLEVHLESKLLDGFVFLLLEKISREFSDELNDLLQKLVKKTPRVLEQLAKLDSFDSPVLMYVEKLDIETKNYLLRQFLKQCQRIEAKHFELLEAVVTNKAETESITKLFTLICDISEEYSKDKSFGKLIFNSVQVLNERLSIVEKQLNLIVAKHNSIWKNKIIKATSSLSNFNDSLMLTQTQR